MKNRKLFFSIIVIAAIFVPSAFWYTFQELKRISVQLNEISEQLSDITLILVNEMPPHSGVNYYYIDPLNGSASGAGSKEEPWGSFDDVIQSGFIQSQDWDVLPYDPGSSKLVDRNFGAPIKPGDIIYLMDGDHGAIRIKGYYNQIPIKVMSAPCHEPVVESISVVSGANWIFQNIKIIGDISFSSDNSGLGPVEGISFENDGYEVSACNW